MMKYGLKPKGTPFDKLRVKADMKALGTIPGLLLSG